MLTRNDIKLGSASGILLFGSIINRTTFKYCDRGIRFAFFDIGAILYSFCLNAVSLDISICPNGGFIDDYLNDLIGFKGQDQLVLLTAVIGK